MEMTTYKRRMNGMAIHMHTGNKSTEDVSNGDQLLPGIPNEITFDLIIPKLPWRAFHALSSASRCWKEAIRTKQVYEARVRANSTDTLVVHIHLFDQTSTADMKETTLALYSTSEKCCIELPRIPFRFTACLNDIRCIVLDGKLYVLGGHFRQHGYIHPIGEVYVLDLAGCRGWKRCASMLQTRSHFGCAVMDGKIYTFGGILDESKSRKDLLLSEVYDIQENTWDPIRSMPRADGRIELVVATAEKELLLYRENIPTLPIYNPAKDEWRLEEHFCNKFHWGVLFVKDDKFYSLSRSRIDVYDIKQHSWINRHTNSFPTVEIDHVGPIAVFAVKDELLLTTVYGKEVGVIQSFECRGFDGDKKELVWHKTNCSKQYFRFKCSIQL